MIVKYIKSSCFKHYAVPGDFISYELISFQNDQVDYFSQDKWVEKHFKIIMKEKLSGLIHIYVIGVNVGMTLMRA